jgi:hypothetical protein
MNGKILSFLIFKNENVKKNQNHLKVKVKFN